MIDSWDETTWLSYYADKYNKQGFNIVNMAEPISNTSRFNKERWNFESILNLIIIICYDNGNKRRLHHK